MIWRTAALALALAGPAYANGSYTLTDKACPYAKDDIPDGYSAACSQMAWTDAGIDFSTTIAQISPADATPDAAPMIYIPGGPGDAPVNKDADVASILSLFPGRTLITLNPRGVKGTSPRPTCTFNSDFWEEELTPEQETQITVGCRDAVTLDLSRFDSPVLAHDIAQMVKALGIEKAGVFGISYGTESALHLLAARADWLELAILDSVSLPGALGTLERLKARDRFLGVIDRLCFADKGCGPAITDNYTDLMAWTAQFDKKPIEVALGPDDKVWTLKAQDMLDFIASMASYPDGAGYGPLFIEAFEDSPDETATWVDTEMEAGFEYALKNFALLYGAFSDSAERDLPAPTAKDTLYPFDVVEYREFARLFRLWNTSDRTEARFVNADAEQEAVDVPVLILSGGVDSLTPLSWAVELDKRFSGFTHFVFPELGHAVAFGTDADVNDKGIAKQLNCGPNVVRAFVAKEDYGICETYLRKAYND